jgi:3-dehydroquinate synthase
MTAIRVAHDGADYDVLVGPFAEAKRRLEEIANGRRLPVVSDERVLRLHGHLLEDVALDEPILVSEGEAAKDWETLERIIDSLAALEVRRGTPVIALGGGSVGDVAGLAASLFKRGCPIIQVPTTLLSQADSAIGGKTAIDAAGQKNLAGSFHHPALVVADPALLDTLDSRQMRSGYAEVVKYGLIDDPAFFAWCERSGRSLLDGDSGARRAAIEHCIRAKARFVMADPDDTSGTRALLNFGHTFGHAIEAVAGHGVLHGEAVAVGIALAFGYSQAAGMCPPADVDRVCRHFQHAGLPTGLAEIDLAGRSDDLLQCMRGDKKAGAGGLTMILTSGIGKAFVSRETDLSTLSDFLKSQA